MHNHSFSGSCFVCAEADRADSGPGASRRTFLAKAIGAPVAAAAAVAPSAARAQPSRQPPSGRFVLRPSWALLARRDDLELVRDPAIVVANGAIEEIGPAGTAASLPSVAMTGQVLLPGFISAHTHVCSGTPTRGIIEGVGPMCGRSSSWRRCPTRSSTR
jgi:hypothetical protein